MSEYVFKLPDLGEGTVEAEIVEWHVNVGDQVKEGDVICDVMTDKANVEVPAPVDGKVLRTNGEPGDVIAVGSELIALEASVKAARRPRGERPEAQSDDVGEARRSARSATAATPESPLQAREPAPQAAPQAEQELGDAATAGAGEKPVPRTPAAQAAAASGDEPVPAEPPPPKPAAERASGRVLTSPAIRRRAKEAGVDLRDVPGSGPKGRILRQDLDALLERGGAAQAAARPADRAPAAGGEEFEENKVIGVRRVIAERMSQSKREIPHYAYVEEVDITELEALRRHLNETFERRLTVLPFIAAGLVRALTDFPQCNARYDAERGMLQRFRPVHLGIATQTEDGLKVPVVREAQEMDLWRLSEEIIRVAAAARDGKAGRGELSGSTITITSLGRMGGIVTTPVINYPEVGIVGVNKAVERPVVVEGQVRIRTIMNLSSSFDHRFVDGFDAAAMIQRLKGLLEHPATLFLTPPA